MISLEKGHSRESIWKTLVGLLGALAAMANAHLRRKVFVFCPHPSLNFYFLHEGSAFKPETSHLRGQDCQDSALSF